MRGKAPHISTTLKLKFWILTKFCFVFDFEEFCWKLIEIRENRKSCEFGKVTKTWFPVQLSNILLFQRHETPYLWIQSQNFKFVESPPNQEISGFWGEILRCAFHVWRSDVKFRSGFWEGFRSFQNEAWSIWEMIIKVWKIRFRWSQFHRSERKSGKFLEIPIFH